VIATIICKLLVKKLRIIILFLFCPRIRFNY
jgi:hypothetical protein